MNILFVCSGNVFRSLSAEYSLKDYAKKHNLKLKISSAGTVAENKYIDKNVLNTLKKYNIDAFKHKPRKITKEIIEKQDLIVAMSTNHQIYIEEHFNIKVPLFNEIAFGKCEPIKDNNEVSGLIPNTEKFDNYNTKIVNYIYNSIPYFAKEFEKFRKNHNKLKKKFKETLNN